MANVEIFPDIYWVGALDWNIQNFHGHTYNTKRGTTYNAYLILDEKIALVDTVYRPFAQEMIEKIKRIVPPEKIDYIIANHAEPDHSGALLKILELCPRAKVFGTARCKDGLAKYYHGAWSFEVVKSGDKIKLGKKTLSFIETPMLHWPDSMFSYLNEEALLLPNDAFGQHYATSKRFDDQVNEAELMEEAKKYYANILWPFSSLVLTKIEQIQKMNLPIKMIAPSHGVIWRKQPNKILDAYLSWAKNQTQPKILIIYETMWGATEKMAKKIVEGIIDLGIAVEVFDITQADRTEVIGKMLDAKGYLFGSSTHDNNMLPTIAGFLELLKGLKPKNRIAGIFGSYGWAGGAIESIAKMLKEAGIEVVQPPLAIQFVPEENALKSCYEYGQRFCKDYL